MLKVSCVVDFNLAFERLALATKQVPFATALALTKTAQNVKAELGKEMATVFKSPTGYTLRSLNVTRAEKATLLASVGVRGGDSGIGAIRWLAPEVHGGERSHAIEALLQPLGLPPNGMFAVPGSKAKLSPSGGVDINWFKSLVSDIASQGVTTSRGLVTKSIKGTGRKRQGALQYAVLMQRAGKLLPGIYGRRGRGIFPFVIFVGRPKYRARFDFYGVAERVARETFPAEFRAAIRKALDSQR